MPSPTNEVEEDEMISWVTELGTGHYLCTEGVAEVATSHHICTEGVAVPLRKSSSHRVSGWEV